MGDRSAVVAELTPAADARTASAAQHSLAPARTPARPALSEALPCDQAVFTSIHSPTGEGYRLIAASPGVRPDEKVEITQRSPSHDSLCDPGPHAVGLLSYTLASGRHCVAYCGHAGREQTARGGQRVYTHMALLTPVDFAAFQNNPVRVHALLADHISRHGPMLKPLARVQPLPLQLEKQTWGPSCAGFHPPSSKTEAAWIWSIADALQGGQRLVLGGTREPLRLLQWAVLCLKPRARRRIDVSAGLKYAPSRRIQLALLSKDDPQTQRLIAGQDIVFRQANTPAPPPSPAFLPWSNLLSAWFEARGVIGPP